MLINNIIILGARKCMKTSLENANKAVAHFSKIDQLISPELPLTWMFIRPPWAYPVGVRKCLKECMVNKLEETCNSEEVCNSDFFSKHPVAQVHFDKEFTIYERMSESTKQTMVVMLDLDELTGQFGTQTNCGIDQWLRTVATVHRTYKQRGSQFKTTVRTPLHKLFSQPTKKLVSKSVLRRNPEGIGFSAPFQKLIAAKNPSHG